MTDNTRAGGARRRTALAGGVLVVAIAAAYARTFSAPFEFDDFISIVRNATIRHLWPLTDVLAPPHASGATVGGRPILNLSFALNYAASGDRVWSYHAVNLAIHAGCALLLFGIIRRTWRWLPGPDPDATERRSAAAGPRHEATSRAIGRAARLACDADWFALAVAAIWALHPLDTEAVTYLSQRAESLAGLFYLLAIYGFVRAMPGFGNSASASLGSGSGDDKAIEPPPASRPATGWLSVSVGACWLGVATKEIVATAPVFLLLFDRTFVAGGFRDAWRARRGYYVALSLSWLVVAALVAGTANRGGTAGFGTGVSSGSYLLTQARAITRYLMLAVWPHPLTFDYGTGLAHGWVEAWPFALFVVALLGVSAVLFFRRPAEAGRIAGFLGVGFFALLAPSSSIVPIGSQTVAEHRMYLPLAMLVVAGLASATRCCGRSALTIGLLLAVVCGVLTWRRNGVYRSGLALWSDTAAHAPNNARAHNNLGDALLAVDRFSDARTQYESAVRLQPDYADAQSNLAHALVKLGRGAEAVSHAEIAARLKPDSPEIQINRGLALSAVHRVPDAIAAFTHALELDAMSLDARYDLANAYYQGGNYGAAVATYEEVLRQEPHRHDARFNLAYTLLQLNRPQDALTQFQVLLADNPDDADAHAEIGNILAHFGRTAEAVAHFEAALRLKPDFPAVRQHYEQLRRSSEFSR